MFAVQMVLVDKNADVLEGKLERWREILEKNRSKISRAKTEFLELRFKNKARGTDSDRNVRLGLINNVEKCKYLGSIVHDNVGGGEIVD